MMISKNLLQMHGRQEMLSSESVLLLKIQFSVLQPNCREVNKSIIVKLGAQKLENARLSFLF